MSHFWQRPQFSAISVAVTWAFLLLLMGRPALALDVGDPAPKLAGKFIQGETVEKFAGDKIYVVEFWATWCGPCKAMIPHLNELHNKFKDRGIVVIGQNVWERDQDLPEPFIKEMGEKMSYRIALDDMSDENEERGVMATTWMTAADRKGIPASFVIGKDGKIAFIGHPNELTEEMMEQLLADKFDPAAAKAKQLAAIKERERRSELSRAIFAAISQKEFSTAETKIAELEEALPEPQRYQATMFRIDLALAKDEQTTAIGLAKDIAAKQTDNPVVVFTLARRLAGKAKPSTELIEAAEALVSKAADKLGKDDITTKMLLAELAMKKGDQDNAVKLQTLVVELSKDAVKPRMQEILEAYKSGKLYEPKNIAPIRVRSAEKKSESQGEGAEKAAAGNADDANKK
jgi:thiol-disulfide isomerase/thioredoxin